jgi:hypothetical protein
MTSTAIDLVAPDARQRVRVVACAAVLMALGSALPIRGASSLVGFGLLAMPVLALTAARDRRDVARVLALAAVFVLFVVLRQRMDDLGAPVVRDAPIVADRVLGAGELPTVRLQRWLRTPGAVTTLDRVTATLYGLHGIAPSATALALLLAGGPHLPRFVAGFAVLVLGTLPLFALWPTMPPWMADPEVGRVLREVAVSIDPAAYQRGAVLDGNPVAAMPSLHMGLAWLVWLTVRPIGRAWSVAGMGYVAAIVWATVYGGEHYVVDLLAGMACAWAAWRLSAPTVRA